MIKKNPIIKLSESALNQLLLMMEHDYTLQGKVFRLSIDTKGCSGFDYAIGFTTPHADDFLLQVSHPKSSFQIALDPFARSYIQFMEIDYQQDFKSNSEGFVLQNKDEKMFHGKFWKSSPELIPSLQH